MDFSKIAFVLALLFGCANAHFQVVMPEDDVAKDGKKTLRIEYSFMHPFEQVYMKMERPTKVGLRVGDKTEDLAKELTEKKMGDANGFELVYNFKKPGDHTFFIEPTPYFEPAERKFIKHLTKTTVNAFGMEEGWDKPLGLKAEIVPLVRPYGLWAGNIFTGRVFYKGKPVANAQIEVEYYNEDSKIKAPTDAHITQVIKADGNGIFHYSMPKAGWWGFAALLEDDIKQKHTDGKEYPVELGAVLWLKTYEF